MVVMATTEREVLKEFIEVYRDNPCLWDMSSELYRNKDLKHDAWVRMTQVLKKMDPDANLCTTKKKVENLRAGFFRELKKVRASERKAAGPSEVHAPNLWYYKLISFVETKDTKERSRRSSDPLQCDIKQAPTSDDTDEESMESTELLQEIEIDPEMPHKRKSYSSSYGSHKKRKKNEITETFVEPLKFEQEYQDRKRNYFGIYVGEQLEQVSTFQRHVAERLISEVLFLAKTGSLNYESSIHSKVGSPRKLQVEVANEQPGTLLKELLIDGQK